MEDNIKESIDILLDSFHKILKINLTNNTFTIVKYNEDEDNSLGHSHKKMSEWVDSLSESGFIYDADIDIYKKSTSLENLRRYFRENKENFRLRYRRKTTGNLYRWAIMEIIPTKEYSDENQTAIMYIKDIHDSYIRELEIHRELEYKCSCDTLTGLSNFYAYRTLCIKYSESERKQSIGVIFADLNGLKIINDTQGHEAGNEYIRTFTKILNEVFPNENCFRISGDEFLIAFSDISETDMQNKFSAISEKINLTKIPIASVGYAWKKKAEFIENVAKEAETGMYENKHAFYEEFPEYKRGVAEENYQREISAIIQNLSEAYHVLISVNLNDNTYQILKTDEKDELSKEKCYSDFINTYVKNNVIKDYRNIFSKFGETKYLKYALKNNDLVSYDYQMKDRTWWQITSRKINSKDGIPTKAILYLQKTDIDRAKRLEQNKHIRYEYQIIEGISEEYTLISLIDLKDKNVSIYKNNGLPDDIINTFNNIDYDTARKWFADKYVIKEDKEMFLRETKLSHIISQLENNKSFKVYFIATPELHNTNKVSYSKFIFYKPIDGSNKLVYATKNITEMVERETELAGISFLDKY